MSLDEDLEGILRRIAIRHEPIEQLCVGHAGDRAVAEEQSGSVTATSKSKGARHVSDPLLGPACYFPRASFFSSKFPEKLASRPDGSPWGLLAARPGDDVSFRGDLGSVANLHEEDSPGTCGRQVTGGSIPWIRRHTGHMAEPMKDKDKDKRPSGSSSTMATPSCDSAASPTWSDGRRRLPSSSCPKLPDGLLLAWHRGKRNPEPYVVEIATYSDQRSPSRPCATCSGLPRPRRGPQRPRPGAPPEGAGRGRRPRTPRARTA